MLYSNGTDKKLFMFIHCLKFHQMIYDTTASTHQHILAPGLSHCSKRTPTLARQMWRHNYVTVP